jgi:hypothetical protein
MVYDLPVDDIKVKPHQVTTLHMICALAFIVAGMIIVVYNYTIPIWGAAILTAGILLTVIVIAKNKWVISPKINPAFRIIELGIAIAIAYYSLLFAILLEASSAKPLSVHLDKDGIKLPSTSRKRFRRWTEIEEVILRFGILTINCTNSTLLQWTITGEEPDPEIFEAWCAAQVEENLSKRINDDW